MAEATELKAVGPERCVFCGGEHFYFASRLLPAFLGRDSVCYVCEAKYKGVRMNNPDRRFSHDSHAESLNSYAAERWRDRVERHDQREG